MSELLVVALGEYAETEIVGKGHNPKVLQYYVESGHKWVKEDEVPWCSAFMNYVARKAGYESTGSLAARSWLKIGEEVSEPVPGDVVIFSRGSKSWQGHVGIFIREKGGKVYTLGGNQGNQVNIKAYSKSRLLGYRRLSPLKKACPCMEEN